MKRLAAVMVAAVMVGAGVAAGTWWQPAQAADKPVREALAAGLGAGAEAAWEVAGGAGQAEGGPLRAAPDEILGEAVLAAGAKPATLISRTVYGPAEITFLLRLVTTAERKTAGFRMTLTDPQDEKKTAAIAISGTYNGNLKLNAAGAATDYAMRAITTIQPTWDDPTRIGIERDMSGLPWSQDKWVHVRYLVGDARTRIWIDDRLLVDRAEGLPARGIVLMDLPPGARLARFQARPPSPTGLFEPLGLDGYAHDRALSGAAGVADDALPFGKTVTIEGVPFRFVERRGAAGADHVNLGRIQLPRDGSVFAIDPACTKMVIPNARYDALYVVAAFDGNPERLPRFSANFYRPGAGFNQIFEAAVPALTARSAPDAKPLPVRLDNGRRANLWLVKVPLDPAKLASFSDMPLLEMELTKGMRQFRLYPDPWLYGWRSAGQPSGVRLYAATLRKAAVDFALEPEPFGHVWTAPETAKYNVTLTNRTAAPRELVLKTKTTSYDGAEIAEQERKVVLPPGQEEKLAFTFPVKKNGIHRLDMTQVDGESAWIETRNFCRLAPNTRPEFHEGEGPWFGYWSYHGGHHTPPGEEIKRLMHLAGAHRARPAPPREGAQGTGPNPFIVQPQWDWAGADPLDPEKVVAFQKSIIEAYRHHYGDHPDALTLYPEPHVTMALTAGHPADYWGGEYTLTDDDKQKLRVHMNTARVVAEAMRATWPKTKILIPHGDPLYVVAFLRAGYPTNLVDGVGLDLIGFERLPEQQIHQQSLHRLYILKEEFKKVGITDPYLPYVEGIFVPTEPGANTWQEQAERYHRWTLISMAYGIRNFGSGWFAFDCGNYYGAQHYGGCGIQRRIPFCDPKPAYAHYATMTRHLERSTFDAWLPTGSHTVFCLKFQKLGQPLYALWTVRGKRPVTLTLAKDATFTVTDSMDNGVPVSSTNGQAAFAIGESPVYVTGAGDITAVALGAPDHSGCVEWARTRNQETWHHGPAMHTPEVAHEAVIADFGDGSWSHAAERDDTYENNNYDTPRFLGRFSTRVADDPERAGRFLAVKLEKQEKERKLMPWYTVLKPRRPVAIPGKANALGVWVKANSDWGRVVYSLRDAKGERWLSVGAPHDWNCNDMHGWSMFNFDGWRYLRFELPSNSEYDAYREYGTTWWGHHGGDGVVDLPLTLEKVIVERRTHVMYVNDPQPANPADVLLGELVAEYAAPADATKAAVAFNRQRIAPPRGDYPLPNPIADMAKNPLDPVALNSVRDPDHEYDGTRTHVNFTETPDAAEYQVWVAAYSDGRGAVVLGTGPKSGFLLRGLRPKTRFHLWVTYKNREGKPSRPSNRLEIELVDAFANK